MCRANAVGLTARADADLHLHRPRSKPRSIPSLRHRCPSRRIVRGKSATLARSKSTSPSRIALSAISLMELEYGLPLDPARARRIEGPLISLIGSIELLAYGAAEASATATVRAAAHTAWTQRSEILR